MASKLKIIAEAMINKTNGEGCAECGIIICPHDTHLCENCARDKKHVK